MTIPATFSELCAVLERLEPVFTTSFLPPPDPSAIGEAESNLGLTFPQDLKDLFTVTGGQDFPAKDADPLFPAIRFRGSPGDEVNMECLMAFTSAVWLNSLEELVDTTQCLRGEFEDLGECADSFVVHGPARYHDNVIGFTGTENSDSLVIDLQPEEGGTVGQVVMVRTQPFEIAVIAPSLSIFLSDILEGYQSGRFRYHDEWAWIDR